MSFYFEDVSTKVLRIETDQSRLFAVGSDIFAYVFVLMYWGVSASMCVHMDM